MGGFVNGLSIVIGLGTVFWVFKELNDGRLGRAVWIMVIAAVLTGYIQSETLRKSINKTAASVADQLLENFDNSEQEDNEGNS